MISQFTAVYEGGLLRPTVPIVLPEGTEVEVTLKTSADTPAVPADGQAAATILAKIAAMPMQPGPEFSGRDHDEILYGERGTP